MTYTSAYVDEFREFGRAALGTAAPVDVLIDCEGVDGEGMRAYIHGVEGCQIKADPPFYGYVDRYVDGTLRGRSMCETRQQYAARITAARNWARRSPAGRATKAGRLTYVGHYAQRAATG